MSGTGLVGAAKRYVDDGNGLVRRATDVDAAAFANGAALSTSLHYDAMGMYVKAIVCYEVAISLMPDGKPKSVLVERIPKLRQRSEILMEQVVAARMEALRSLDRSMSNISVTPRGPGGAVSYPSADHVGDESRRREEVDLHATLNDVKTKLSDVYRDGDAGQVVDGTAGTSNRPCSNCVCRREANEEIPDGDSSAELYEAARKKFDDRANDYLSLRDGAACGCAAELQKVESCAAVYRERAAVMERWRDESEDLREKDYGAGAALLAAANATVEEADEAHAEAALRGGYDFAEGLPSLPGSSQPSDDDSHDSEDWADVVDTVIY
jgi:hypothetical protein